MKLIKDQTTVYNLQLDEGELRELYDWSTRTGSEFADILFQQIFDQLGPDE